MYTLTHDLWATVNWKGIHESEPETRSAATSDPPFYLSQADVFLLKPALLVFNQFDQDTI